jgi:hypothetical protein
MTTVVVVSTTRRRGCDCWIAIMITTDHQVVVTDFSALLEDDVSKGGWYEANVDWCG